MRRNRGVPEHRDPRRTRGRPHGAVQLASSSILGLERDRPVTFPPGAGKASDSPDPTGSPTCTITIGIVPVACFRCLGSLEWVVATITSTWSRTNSEARSGSARPCPPRYRCSMTMILALDIAPLLEPFPGMPLQMGKRGRGRAQLRQDNQCGRPSPGCWASAASGAARRPPEEHREEGPRRSSRVPPQPVQAGVRRRPVIGGASADVVRARRSSSCARVSSKVARSAACSAWRLAFQSAQRHRPEQAFCPGQPSRWGVHSAGGAPASLLA